MCCFSDALFYIFLFKYCTFSLSFCVSLWKRNCKLPYSLSTISVEIYQSLIGNDLWSWAFYSTNEHVSCTFYYFRIICVCMLNGNKLRSLSRKMWIWVHSLVEIDCCLMLWFFWSDNQVKEQLKSFDFKVYYH